MMNADTVESILNKVAAGFTVYSVDILTRSDMVAPNGCGFHNVEAAIAAHGDEEVYKWRLESMYNGKVLVTINLENEF